MEQVYLCCWDVYIGEIEYTYTLRLTPLMFTSGSAFSIQVTEKTTPGMDLYYYLEVLHFLYFFGFVNSVNPIITFWAVIILIASLVAHLKLVAMNREIDNNLEAASISILLLAFVTGIIFGYYQPLDNNGTVVVSLLVAWFGLLALILLFFALHVWTVLKFLRNKATGRTKSDIELFKKSIAAEENIQKDLKGAQFQLRVGSRSASDNSVPRSGSSSSVTRAGSSVPRSGSSLDNSIFRRTEPTRSDSDDALRRSDDALLP